MNLNQGNSMNLLTRSEEPPSLPLVPPPLLRNHQHDYDFENPLVHRSILMTSRKVGPGAVATALRHPPQTENFVETKTRTGEEGVESDLPSGSDNFCDQVTARHQRKFSPFHSRISLTYRLKSPLVICQSNLRRHRLVRRSQAEEFLMTSPESASHGAPRRFVSGMRLECKPIPWRFSSSIHLKIGSTKRRYTEKVFYKMRLVPYGYFEGATADFCHEANPGAKRYIATMTLECTNVPLLQLQQPRLEDEAEHTEA